MALPLDDRIEFIINARLRDAARERLGEFSGQLSREAGISDVARSLDMFRARRAAKEFAKINAEEEMARPRAPVVPGDTWLPDEAAKAVKLRQRRMKSRQDAFYGADGDQ
jgi:hypothetical protein